MFSGQNIFTDGKPLPQSPCSDSHPHLFLPLFYKGTSAFFSVSYLEELLSLSVRSQSSLVYHFTSIKLPHNQGQSFRPLFYSLFSFRCPCWGHKRKLIGSLPGCFHHGKVHLAQVPGPAFQNVCLKSWQDKFRYLFFISKVKKDHNFPSHFQLNL